MTEDEAVAIAKMTGAEIAAVMAALSGVLTSLISLLVKQGHLSSESVQKEWLDSLEEIYRSPKKYDFETEKDAGELESQRGLQLIALLRSRLFGDGSVP
jgi:nucleotide-binding universal stress UspA family protein